MSIVGKELVQRVKQYLDSNDLSYSIVDGFQLDFNLDNRLESCRMHIRFISYGESSFSVHTKTSCILPVPSDKQNSLFGFITRANYGIADGYFSYLADTPSEGTIEYNSWLYCNNSIPSLHDIQGSMVTTLHMLEIYGDALLNVVKLGADPAEEIQRVEE